MKGSPLALSHLLTHWETVASRLRESKRVAVFLDFDGTLVPIARRPNQVRLAPSTRRLLRRLASHPRVRVTIISGRRRAELLHYIAVPKVRYFGLYGWESSSRSTIPAAARIALRRAHAVLRENLPTFPGVWVEDKTGSLSIHLLAAKPAVKRSARRRIPSLLRPFRKSLRLLENVRDLEIIPQSMPDKGTAVRQCLADRRFHAALPLYFGDDYSDESAFAAVGPGVSVLVGKRRKTNARFQLRSPDELADVLARLEAAIS